MKAGAGFTGKFVDFQVIGTGTVFSIDGTGTLNASGIATTGNFTQTGAGTFSTGTGAVSLNGDVTLASGKNFTAAGGASAFDFSASRARSTRRQAPSRCGAPRRSRPTRT